MVEPDNEAKIEALKKKIREKKLSFFDVVMAFLLVLAQRLCARSGHGIVVILPSGQAECTLCHKRGPTDGRFS